MAPIKVEETNVEDVQNDIDDVSVKETKTEEVKSETSPQDSNENEEPKDKKEEITTVTLQQIPQILGAFLLQYGVTMKPKDLRAMYTLFMYEFLKTHEPKCREREEKLKNDGITDKDVLSSIYKITGGDKSICLPKKTFQDMVGLYYHSIYHNQFAAISNM